MPEALALGVLQGATEFLPVSSSGHLVLAQNLMPGAVEDTPVLLFDLVVHLGTLGAILWVLRARVASLIRAGASYVGLASAEGMDVERRWLWLIVAGSVPTAAIGLALRDVVEEAHAHPAWVGAALCATAAILVASECIGTRTRGAGELGWADALWIGAVQGLAVMPGISRSGSTVGVALFRGARAETAVEFSMLLSIPAIVGASLLEVLRAGPEALAAGAVPLAVAFTSALVVGAAALRALQWVVSRRKLVPFAAYCAILGVGAMIVG